MNIIFSPNLNSFLTFKPLISPQVTRIVYDFETPLRKNKCVSVLVLMCISVRVCIGGCVTL